MQVRIREVGLKQLTRELRRIDRELPKRLSESMRPLAARTAAAAQTRAQAMGSVHAHVAPGISSGATGGRPYVSLNPGRHPAILGAEFGGGFRPTTRQFPRWMGNGAHAGYMVLPTLRQENDNIAEGIEAAVFGLLENL